MKMIRNGVIGAALPNLYTQTTINYASSALGGIGNMQG